MSGNPYSDDEYPTDYRKRKQLRFKREHNPPDKDEWIEKARRALRAVMANEQEQARRMAKR